MDFINPLVQGSALLLDPLVLFLVIAGTLWGLLAGALPGIGSPVAVGVMIPFTFLMGPVEAIAMLVAISFATGYGNSIPAVLVGVPGNTSAFLTAIDGYALHRKGQSGLGLGAAYFGTVMSQWVGLVMFTVMVIPLSRLPYHFLAPELFALYFMGMAAVIALTGKNVMKGLIAGAFGIALSLVGPDPVTNLPRLTFGIRDLQTGLETVPVVIGLIAVGELLRNLRQIYGWSDLSADFRIKFPRLREYRRMIAPTLGGAVIGTIMGAIPGLGSTPAAALGYQQARLFSKHPEEFGEGSVDGIAANEAAGSAANAGELVPTLGLGIPGSATTALLLGALTIHGLLAGPLLIIDTPELLHAAIAGGVGGTIFVGATGAIIAKRLLKLALMDRQIVLVSAIFIIVVGIFAVRQSMFDVWVLLVFSLAGYFMLRYGYSPAAAGLGLILGSGFETHLRLGLMMSDNSPVQFFTRPLTAPIMLFAIAFLGWGVFSTWKILKRERLLAAELEAEEESGGPGRHGDVGAGTEPTP